MNYSDVAANEVDDFDNTTELEALLRNGVSLTLAGGAFSHAFESFLDEFPQLAPGLAGKLLPGAERGFVFAMMREIWNHVPRPERDWKPQPLPKPERNAPCPCNSGTKYKQCCGDLEGMPGPFGPAGSLSLLGYVLEAQPVTHYKDLPFKRLNPEEVAHVAEQWMNDGRAGPARFLLEGLLAPGGKFDVRHEYGFDMLCDIYLDANEPERRVALVERFMQTPDKELKVAAMQRRCSMLADEDDHAAAWALFKETQRIDPDNPALAHLELSLLVGQGELERASERARYWSLRLRKLGFENEGLFEFLDGVAADPHMLLRLMTGEDAEPEADLEDEDDEDSPDAVLALLAQIDALPAAACHYALTPSDGHAGPLQPDPAMAELEARFFVLDEENAEELDIAPVVRFVTENPLAWQSFAIVEVVLEFMLEGGLFEELADRIDAAEGRLLEHAVRLLEQVIAQNAATDCTLEWGWTENRPALRLLADAIDRQGDTAQALAWLEWLVLRLNPADNTGHRVALVHRLCAAGRAAEALAVLERYPDDALPGMLYGRVLVLVMLGRRAEATAALAIASQRYPKLLKTLLATRPKMPELSMDHVTVGGDDDAWYYRADWSYAWQQGGAFDWLRSMAGKR